MAQSIKLKNNTYWDSKGITHNKKLLSDILYPVGSIYMSVDSTSPATLFGGTWTKIEGRFLWATGSTPKVMGGSRTTDSPNTNTTGSTVLTESQLPYIDGAVAGVLTYGSNGSGHFSANKENPVNGASGSTNHWSTIKFACGGNAGHTHTLNSHTHTYMPPYFEVYMWYRTA